MPSMPHVSCSKTKCKTFLKNNALILATIVGVVLGIILGISVRGANLSRLDIAYFRFPGDLLLQMLKMIILPLIVTSLITGVATLDQQASGKLGARAIIYYMTTTLIAVIIGIIMVVSINPGRGGKDTINSMGKVKEVEPVDALLDLLRNLFPTNLVQACFQQYETTRQPVYDKKNVTRAISNGTGIYGNTTTVVYEQTQQTIVEENVVVDYTLAGNYKSGVNVLGLICFCLTFGVIIGKMGKEGEILVKFFSAFNEAIMKIVNIVIWYSPIGITFLIAAEILKMQNPYQVLAQLGLYIATVTTGLIIHGFIVLPLIYFIVVRKNPFKYMFGVLQAWLTALATASSSATLPVTINCVETNCKVDRRVARFVLPVGATINMDGTALYEAVAAIFIAQVNGIGLNFGQIITVSLTATLASIGAAGVPQAGLVTLIIVLSAVGLPSEDITVILAIDWLLDRFRTSINVLGDSIGAGVVAHLSRDDLQNLSFDGGDDIFDKMPGNKRNGSREKASVYSNDEAKNVGSEEDIQAATSM